MTLTVWFFQLYGELTHLPQPIPQKPNFIMDLATLSLEQKYLAWASFLSHWNDNACFHSKMVAARVKLLTAAEIHDLRQLKRRYAKFTSLKGLVAFSLFCYSLWPGMVLQWHWLTTASFPVVDITIWCECSFSVSITLSCSQYQQYKCPNIFTFDEMCCLITAYVLPYALWARTIIIWELRITEYMIPDY